MEVRNVVQVSLQVRDGETSDRVAVQCVDVALGSEHFPFPWSILA